MISKYFTQNAQFVRTYVRGIESSIRIGLYDEERLASQRICVDADLWSRNPVKKSFQSPEYIDYDIVRNLVITDWPSRPHVELLETLAAELIDHCFKESRVIAARVTISKLDLPNTTHAGVELYKRRTNRFLSLPLFSFE